MTGIYRDLLKPNNDKFGGRVAIFLTRNARLIAGHIKPWCCYRNVCSCMITM